METKKDTLQVSTQDSYIVSAMFPAPYWKLIYRFICNISHKMKFFWEKSSDCRYVVKRSLLKRLLTISDFFLSQVPVKE